MKDGLPTIAWFIVLFDDFLNTALWMIVESQCVTESK